MAIIPKSIFLLIIGVVATLFSIALAIPGTAGFYRKEYYVPTVCYGKKPQVPSPCTGKSVVVKVVDNCPGCGPSEHVTMDISEDAYRIIANPVVVQGHVSIDYV
ncbi:putative EG45-like domain containing protein 1, partial [Solanum stenotomum]|uniref:putative EG45-like domain containing protein 1 n=1 Tax=Solanum stenotomum TaxID=172797 RepID=UPI0020D008C3